LRLEWHSREKAGQKAVAFQDAAHGLADDHVALKAGVNHNGARGEQ